jgi:hypothetical protein
MGIDLALVWAVIILFGVMVSIWASASSSR